MNKTVYHLSLTAFHIVKVYNVTIHWYLLDRVLLGQCKYYHFKLAWVSPDMPILVVHFCRGYLGQTLSSLVGSC